MHTDCNTIGLILIKLHYSDSPVSMGVKTFLFVNFVILSISLVNYSGNYYYNNNLALCAPEMTIIPPCSDFSHDHFDVRTGLRVRLASPCLSLEFPKENKCNK